MDLEQKEAPSPARPGIPMQPTNTHLKVLCWLPHGCRLTWPWLPRSTCLMCVPCLRARQLRNVHCTLGLGNPLAFSIHGPRIPVAQYGLKTIIMPQFQFSRWINLWNCETDLLNVLLWNHIDILQFCEAWCWWIWKSILSSPEFHSAVPGTVTNDKVDTFKRVAWVVLAHKWFGS